jgi:hypothetical protein
LPRSGVFQTILRSEETGREYEVSATDLKAMEHFEDTEPRTPAEIDKLVALFGITAKLQGIEKIQKSIIRFIAAHVFPIAKPIRFGAGLPRVRLGPGPRCYSAGS